MVHKLKISSVDIEEWKWEAGLKKKTGHAAEKHKPARAKVTLGGKSVSLVNA